MAKDKVHQNRLMSKPLRLTQEHRFETRFEEGLQSIDGSQLGFVSQEQLQSEESP